MTLPPSNAKFDYQLGGAYTPPAGVTAVSRDRNASPAPGLFNICYVNGFQIQPDEASTWQAQYPDLILRDAGGNPIIDTASRAASSGRQSTTASAALSSSRRASASLRRAGFKVDPDFSRTFIGSLSAGYVGGKLTGAPMGRRS